MQYEQKPEELSKPEAKEQEAKPVETKTNEIKPVETKTPESKPVETKTPESKPVETKTPDTKQEETKTPQTKPQTPDTKTLDTKPEEVKEEPKGFLAKAKAAQAKVKIVLRTIPSIMFFAFTILYVRLDYWLAKVSFLKKFLFLHAFIMLSVFKCELFWNDFINVKNRSFKLKCLGVNCRG